jgi:hypothetical protein
MMVSAAGLVALATGGGGAGGVGELPPPPHAVTNTALLAQMATDVLKTIKRRKFMANPRASWG